MVLGQPRTGQTWDRTNMGQTNVGQDKRGTGQT